MIIALITDQHFGARDGKEIFHDYYEKFYTNIFFPTLERYGVKTVLGLGDMFDRRRSIDFVSLKRSKEYFFEPLKKAGVEMHALVGNHDIALRNSLAINSPDLLLSEFTNIFPIDKPTELSFGSTNFLMVPWICHENEAEVSTALKNSAAHICCGHFEISGFAMYRGMESHEGLESNVFANFERVFSGHYHHRSTKGHITYLGNPVQLTHMDQGDVRGFHLFDTETRHLTFVPNTYEMFTRCVYDDESLDPMGIDVSAFKETYLKVVVQKKTDFFKYDQFMERLYNCGAHDVKVVESLADMVADELTEDIDIEDTRSILQHYVEKAEVTVDRAELSKFIGTLYLEAISESNG